MKIQKISLTHCQLLPYKFLKKNLSGRKFQIPLPQKYQWLKNYADDNLDNQLIIQQTSKLLPQKKIIVNQTISQLIGKKKIIKNNSQNKKINKQNYQDQKINKMVFRKTSSRGISTSIQQRSNQNNGSLTRRKTLGLNQNYINKSKPLLNQKPKTSEMLSKDQQFQLWFNQYQNQNYCFNQNSNKQIMNKIHNYQGLNKRGKYHSEILTTKEKLYNSKQDKNQSVKIQPWQFQRDQDQLQYWHSNFLKNEKM